MTKIAIPITENVLSQTFGNCSFYEVVEINERGILTSSQKNPSWNNLVEFYAWIEKEGITDVIVHDIDRASMNYFADTKINLFVGIHINSPENIMEEYLKGTLKSDAKTILK